MTRMALLTAAVVAGLAGCGVKAPRLPDRVPVKGQVTFANGKPVKDVLLSLQPVERGHGALLKLGADGTFRGELVPGKYEYCLEPLEGRAAAVKAVPEKYRKLAAEHAVEVKSGENLQIKLN